MRRKLLFALAVLGILALVVFGLWAWFAGPCWLYDFNRAADIPGRCT